MGGVQRAAVHVHDVRVPMRDGIELATDLYIPDDGQKHPALLVRSPYSRDALRFAHDPIAASREGWVVALQDVRGRGHSGGVFQPFHQESLDGHDAVAWCAAQPWCDGRVAMMGASYNGATQWLAAITEPPALKAIAPAVIGCDFRDEFCYEGGAFESAGMGYWALALASTASDPVVARTASDLLPHWPALLDSPAGRSDIAQVLPEFAHWSQPEDREYWDPITISKHRDRVDLPAFHLAGWYDPFCEGVIRSYNAMSCGAASEYARRSQRLVVGPWTHTGIYDRIICGLDFGVEAHAIGVATPREILRFLRTALDHGEVDAGISVFVMGTNEWRALPSWPPSATPARLYFDADRGANSLSGDGRLLWGRQPLPGADEYIHEPGNPVPNRGGRTLVPTFALSGPLDQRVVEERQDVLVYTSEVFAEPITCIGMVSAEVVLVSTANEVDLVVKLCVVRASGLVINLVDSILRLAVVPGVPCRAHVDVGSTAVVVDRGESFRVEVASSNYPRYAPLPRSGVTIVRGESHVVVPVIE